MVKKDRSGEVLEWGERHASVKKVEHARKLAKGRKKKVSVKREVALSNLKVYEKEAKLSKSLPVAGTLFSQMPEEFKLRGDRLKVYRLFCNWVSQFSERELDEVAHLENLRGVLESDVANRTVDKLKAGEVLDEGDRKMLLLMKDLLVDMHKIKFGEKKVNVSVGYKDIRELMRGKE